MQNCEVSYPVLSRFTTGMRGLRPVVGESGLSRAPCRALLVVCVPRQFALRVCLGVLAAMRCVRRCGTCWLLAPVRVSRPFTGASIAAKEKGPVGPLLISVCTGCYIRFISDSVLLYQLNQLGGQYFLAPATLMV